MDWGPGGPPAGCLQTMPIFGSAGGRERQRLDCRLEYARQTPAELELTHDEPLPDRRSLAGEIQIPVADEHAANLAVECQTQRPLVSRPDIRRPQIANTADRFQPAADELLVQPVSGPHGAG